MAYKAYLNNTTLFYDSSVRDESFFLSYAVLDLESGTSGDFTFRVPPTNVCYSSFHLLTDYIDVYRDDDCIFSGRVYSITEETDTQLMISCEGLLSLLADSIFRPITYEGTLRNLVTQIVASHDAQVGPEKGMAIGTLTIPDSDVYRDYQNYDTSISRLKDLVNSFGGYMYVTKETGIETSVVDIGIVDVGIVDIGANGIRYNLNWVPDFTDPCTQIIELNSNLINITQEENGNGIITVLIPTGAIQDDGNRLTIKSVNGGLDYIVADSSYISKYGYVFGTYNWNDVHYANILKTKAQNYLNEILQPKITIELTAADLADAGYTVDAFRIGQKITVKSDPHGIDYVQFNCQKQRLDLLHPEQNRLTLGTVKTGFVESSVNTIDKIETTYATLEIMKSITSIITGNSGGYVIFHDSDGDNHPDEILIMDTPDINTAVKVWRWNKSGLGYSSNGYNGPFGLAMTIDGQIVADFITAGTLSGDRVRAGYIESVNGTSYWDLDTDTFSCANANITGGRINIETDSDDLDTIILNYTDSLSSKKVQLAPTSVRLDFDSSLRSGYGIFSSSGYAIYNGPDSNSVGLQADLTGQTHGAMFNLRYDNDKKVEFDTTGGFGKELLNNASGTAVIKLEGNSGLITCVSLTQTSDERAKNSIESLDAEKSAEFIYGISPVEFRYNNSSTGSHHGFTTGDVEKVISKVYGDSEWGIITTPEGGYKSLAYTELIADLVATVQQQHKQIEALGERIEALEKRS